MGHIVTLMTSGRPETLWTEQWPVLLGMAAVLLLVRPSALMIRDLVSNQAISVNVANMIRWQNHWHVARQSWAFFQNDFAGRIANRVMQTGPAIRESLVHSFAMFRLFEKPLDPTEPPSASQPPAGLLAFYWHFARQAKGLFAALFVAGFVVALLDATIPVFIGRIVTLVTRADAGRRCSPSTGRCCSAWRSCCWSLRPLAHRWRRT